jgi:hypothetical protein
VAAALANPLAQFGCGAWPSPTPKPDTIAQCGAAGPDSSREWPCLVMQRPTLSIFNFLNMFIYTNSYSIAKFTFNYNLWHYVQKVVKFVVDELMYACESSTSKLTFWLGISGLIALCLYSHVVHDMMWLILVPFIFLEKNYQKNCYF